MNDRREELLYRKVNQLAAFVMAGCAILALLIGVVGILLQGQIKQARQDAAELELRLGQLERRLDQRAMAQVEPATPVKPPRRSRRRSPNTPPPATKPATEQRPSPVASGPVSPNRPILEKLKSLDPDDAQAGTVLDQLAADPQAVAQMDIDALAKAVRIKAALGDGPGTLEWGQRALLVDPNHTGVLLLMAEAALDLGRFAEAESLIARVAESSDPSGWAHLLRGRIALGVGKTKQARQALNQAKKSPGQAADAALLLAEMALAAGDLDAAQAELDYCEAVEADRPQALRLQAELFFERRQFDEFVDAVGRLIRTAGADHSLRVLLGRALIQLGRLGPAVAELQGVVDQDPENAAAWHWLGVARIKELQPAQAIEHLTRSIELNPSSALAWHHLGVAWANRDDCVAAVEAFDQALALDADLAEAHFGRAVCLARTDQPKKARAAADRAVQLDPDLADSLGRITGLGRPRRPAEKKPGSSQGA